MLLTGDLVLDVADPDHWLSGIVPATRAAAVTIGHLEVPHTRRGTELVGDVPAPGADPGNLAALQRAGFDVLTLAGNHMADRGPEGIADTRDELERLGIRYTGAGENLQMATAPARLEINNHRISVLSYNCVGPESSWATPQRAGCAYVRIESADGSPTAPSAPLTRADPVSLERMSVEIQAARRQSSIVVVALHKGIVHTPAKLAPYERPVAFAAIEAGADVVVGHHAHIVRGIEIYRGKPVFHGLGNGCVVTHALRADQEHPARAAWAQKRRKLFGFEPDPAYPLAPFHPEAVNAMLGWVRCQADGALEAGFIPVYVEPPGRPVLADATRGASIAKYLQNITTAAGLPTLTLKPEADGRISVL